MGNQGPIAHVGLLDDVTWTDAYQLCHQTIHHVGIILRLIGFAIRNESQLYQFGVGNIIQPEEVGPRLLYRIPISLQSIGIHTRQQLSASMSQTFVQIGVQVITDVAIFIDETECFCIDDELFPETISMRGLVIGICNIADRDALGTILGPNPVCIRQINADGGRGIFIATQHSRTDDIGRDALDHRFAETGING